MGVFRSLKSVTKLNLDMASVNEEDPLNSLWDMYNLEKLQKATLKNVGNYRITMTRIFHKYSFNCR